VYEKSNAWARKDLAKREIRLFEDLFAGNISSNQARILSEHFQIVDWVDVYIKYERLLRAKSDKGCMDIHNKDNYSTASAIMEYVRFLQGRLDDINPTMKNYDVNTINSAYSSSLPRTTSQSIRSGSVKLPSSKNKKTNVIDFRWSEKSAIIAEQQLDKLYSSLIKPKGWGTPFIDCTREVFLEVIKGNSEMKIIWTSNQIYLLWLLMLLENKKLIKKPYPYYRNIIKSFAPIKGEFSNIGLRDSNRRLKDTDIEEEPYASLSTIVNTLMIAP
jgi:hypothetical protein